MVKDSKTPAEIAKIAYPESAQAELWRWLRGEICEALAAGELVPCEEVATCDGLSAEDKARYKGAQPIFNPRVSGESLPGCMYCDPRETASDFLSGGDIYSEFNVTIPRRAFHAWRAETDRMRLPDELFIRWPAPRELTKGEIHAAVVAALRKHPVVAAAIRLVSAATGESVDNVKKIYYDIERAANGDAAKKKAAKEGVAKEKAPPKATDRRLRILPKSIC